MKLLGLGSVVEVSGHDAVVEKISKEGCTLKLHTGRRVLVTLANMEKCF